MKVNLHVLITVKFLLLAITGFSQECNHIQDSTIQEQQVIQELSAGICKSYNGFQHTPKGNIHIMYLIVDFTDAQPDAESSWWPEDGIPTYAGLNGISNNLLDINLGSPSNNNNLSTWYSSMSANNFSITGEVFKVVINENPNFGIMTTAAFAALENQNPNKDWSAFDQRQNFPNFSYDNSVYKSNGDPAGGDGKLDFVFIHFRKNNVGANIAGLWSSPTLTTTFGGGKSYTTGAGATLANLFKHDKLMEYFTHEFAHNLYNSPQLYGCKWDEWKVLLSQ
ncbi:MAG: hypothetical protein MH472_04235 [Bacteroidia bacterium]|nr:hypothetical protein [Bacteroidia bacterium]